MTFARYWELDEFKDFSPEVLSNVEKIIKFGEKELDLRIGDGIGEGEPVLTPKKISFNGYMEDDEDYDSIVISEDHLGGNHSKTNRNKYDAVVNAVLMYLEDEGFIRDARADDFNDEITACYLYSLLADNPIDFFAALLNKKFIGKELTPVERKMFESMIKAVRKEENIKEALSTAKKYISYLDSIDEGDNNFVFFDYQSYLIEEEEEIEIKLPF